MKARFKANDDGSGRGRPAEVMQVSSTATLGSDPNQTSCSYNMIYPTRCKMPRGCQAYQSNQKSDTLTGEVEYRLGTPLHGPHAIMLSSLEALITSSDIVSDETCQSSSSPSRSRNLCRSYGGEQNASNAKGGFHLDMMTTLKDFLATPRSRGIDSC